MRGLFDSGAAPLLEGTVESRDAGVPGRPSSSSAPSEGRGEFSVSPEGWNDADSPAESEEGDSAPSSSFLPTLLEDEGFTDIYATCNRSTEASDCSSRSALVPRSGAAGPPRRGGRGAGAPDQNSQQTTAPAADGHEKDFLKRFYLRFLNARFSDLRDLNALWFLHTRNVDTHTLAVHKRWCALERDSGGNISFERFEFPVEKTEKRLGELVGRSLPSACYKQKIDGTEESFSRGFYHRGGFYIARDSSHGFLSRTEEEPPPPGVARINAVGGASTSSDHTGGPATAEAPLPAVVLPSWALAAAELVAARLNVEDLAHFGIENVQVRSVTKVRHAFAAARESSAVGRIEHPSRESSKESGGPPRVGLPKESIRSPLLASPRPASPVVLSPRLVGGAGGGAASSSTPAQHSSTTLHGTTRPRSGGGGGVDLASPPKRPVSPTEVESPGPLVPPIAGGPEAPENTSRRRRAHRLRGPVVVWTYKFCSDARLPLAVSIDDQTKKRRASRPPSVFSMRVRQ